jgi:preprotein translocase SecE subunit
MVKYKPDQGTYARTSSFLLLAALGAFGCHTLYEYLISFRGTEADPGFLVSELSNGPVPVLGLAITPALLIATLVAAGVLWFLLWFHHLPKVADMLIECEIEMRKCTWPSFDETWKASLVVLGVMVFFTFVLAGMDWLLNKVMVGYVF